MTQTASCEAGFFHFTTKEVFHWLTIKKYSRHREGRQSPRSGNVEPFKAAPPVQDQPAPAKMEVSKGKDAPVPTGKVVDFTAARDAAAKGKPSEKAAAPDKGKQANKAKDAAKPRRGRPVRMTRRPPTRPSRSFGARTVNMAAFGGVPIPLRRSVCVCLHLTAEHQGIVSKRPEAETAVLYR